MSDTPTGGQNQQQTIVYLLAGVAVLLLAIVVVLVLRGNQSTVPPVAATTADAAAAAAAAAPAAADTAPFDATKATKVPSGVLPKDYVAQYYQAILDKKWDKAFKMQPTDSQTGNTVQGFQDTQVSYGMASFKVLSSKTSGDQMTVEAEQNLGANGTWGAQWIFVKYQGAWVVKDKTVQMK
ncbi:MAG: hypothetical protein WC971_07555 [Coriobacteriia bacterium]